MVNIKVAVRVRPPSPREHLQNETIVVDNSEKCILVTNPKISDRAEGFDSRQRIRRFAVDYCYDFRSQNASQEAIYDEIGNEVLDYITQGYNACVLAYGHSASGKTYTMMGDETDIGLKPRICRGIFERMRMNTEAHHNLTVSFLEIYNEKVRDLLVDDEGNFSLRVREHPRLGPYVQDLSEVEVLSEEDLLNLLQRGNSRRSTAVTESNSRSSRSHAVFTLRFHRSNDYSVFSSKLHLVDLAGSERAGSIQSRVRLKEGANINKSLVTLGNVISALADSCEIIWPRETSRNWQPFVPYRDSVLTWLLKDTLGGNSNTIMIATISPASSCYSDTINTLRYAKRTKKIVNQPIINEDPKIRTIRELKEEISRLKSMLIEHDTSVNGTKITPTLQCAVGLQTEDFNCDWLRNKSKKDNGDTTSHSGSEERIAESALTLRSRGLCRNSNGGNATCGNSSSSSRFIIKRGTKRGGLLLIKKRRRFSRHFLYKMLHRGSRPDLIRSINKAHSASSNTSGAALSQSTSETSLNSAGRRASLSRTSSIGEASGSSTPTPILKTHKRQEIVSAVTSRLYDMKKKPDDEENLQQRQEDVKLCKRTRMKLFDISRKLAMTKRPRRPVSDNVVQTEDSNSTLRVKEKSTVTENVSQNMENYDIDKCEFPVTINHVIVPSGRFVLDCGPSVRLESSITQESCTQTEPLKIEQGTSPIRDAEISDDSLESKEQDPLPLATTVRKKRKRFRHSTGNIQYRPRLSNKRSLDSLLLHCSHPKEPVYRYHVSGTNAFYEYDPTGKEWVIFKDPKKSQEHCHESDFVASSTDTSLNSVAASDCMSSSGTSSGDFIFYDKMPDRDIRELYTISESSELVDNNCKNQSENNMGSWTTLNKSDTNQSVNVNVEEKNESNESLTFVYLGPKIKETSVLMEVIQRSLQSNVFDKQTASPLTRSVSVDTAMSALHNAVNVNLNRSTSEYLTRSSEKACQSDTPTQSLGTFTIDDKEINTDRMNTTETQTFDNHFSSPTQHNDLLLKTLDLDSVSVSKPLQIDCGSQTRHVRFSDEKNETETIGELIKEAATLIKALQLAKVEPTCNLRVYEKVTEAVQTDVQKEDRFIQTSGSHLTQEERTKLNFTWPRRRVLNKPPIAVRVPSQLSIASKADSLGSNSDNGLSHRDDFNFRQALEFEESCRRLEEAIQKDQLREENYQARSASFQLLPIISPRKVSCQMSSIEQRLHILLPEDPITTPRQSNRSPIFSDIKTLSSNCNCEKYCSLCSRERSLEKCNKKCGPSCRSSPSAYLKHLVELRRRIVSEEFHKEI